MSTSTFPTINQNPCPRTREARPDGFFSAIEQQALLGFLGGYSGLTRDAYALDLRQFASWCQQRQVALFDVARRDIEGFARQLEELGRARATISRRLCTITSLYGTPA